MVGQLPGISTAQKYVKKNNNKTKKKQKKKKKNNFNWNILYTVYNSLKFLRKCFFFSFFLCEICQFWMNLFETSCDSCDFSHIYVIYDHTIIDVNGYIS